MRVPSTNSITMPFGAVWDPYSVASPHKGTDFSYIPDSIIYAPCDGKVQLVPNNGNDGNGVYMYDPQAKFHGMLHTSKYLVSNGATVKEGQPLAIMGDTGFAQGVHLHWCVKVGSQFIDPMSLIKEDDMFTLTKEQIMAISRMATGDYPGDGFDYNKFTGQPASQAVIDELIQSFAPYSEKRIAEYASLQQKVSQGAGGDFVPVGEQLYKKA